MIVHDLASSVGTCTRHRPFRRSSIPTGFVVSRKSSGCRLLHRREGNPFDNPIAGLAKRSIGLEGDGCTGNLSRFVAVHNSCFFVSFGPVENRKADDGRQSVALFVAAVEATLMMDGWMDATTDGDVYPGVVGDKYPEVFLLWTFFVAVLSAC